MKRGAIEKLILMGDKTLAARYVAIVRHKAIETAKRLTPGAVLNDYLKFSGGWAKIQVREGRRRLIIYAEAGGPLYEFFTSELIDKDVTGTPPYVGTGGYGTSVCGAGSIHKIFGASAISTPLVKLCDGCVDGEPPDPGEDDLPYQLMDCETNIGLDDMNTPDFWDFKKNGFHIWWKNNLGSQFVVSQHDVNAYYSRRLLQSRFNGSMFFRPVEFYSDGTEDPKVYSYDSKAPIASGSPDMTAGKKRRKACLLSSPNHTVVVMVDNEGTFYAWKPGVYATAAEIQRVAVVTPSYDSRIKTGLGTWNFNSEGTKAVAIGIERVQSELNASSNVVYKATIGQIEGEDYGFGSVGVGYGGAKHLAMEDSPHLVEVQLSLTEDDLGDWVFAVNIIRSERYAETGRWFIAADYLVGDSRLPRPKDSLVALTFEMEYEVSDGLFLGGTHFPDDIHAKINTSVLTNVWVDDPDNPVLSDWQDITRYPMYGNVRVNINNLNPVKDPFGNTIETWQSTQISDGGGYLPLYSKTIRAMNLRTLSFLFLTEQINNTGSGNKRSWRSEVHAYGQIEDAQQLVDTSAGAVTFDSPWGNAGYNPIPTSYLSLISNYAENHYQAWWLNQFSWHPKGHWAINHYLYPVPSFDLANWQVDVVNTRIGGVDNRTTHRELYNSAFSDTRTDQYYDDPTKPDAYRGVFRTGGLWRDN